MNRLSPEALARSLDVASAKIEVLQGQESRLLAMLDSLRQERVSLEQHRDELETQRYPIHWLPPELLIQIFAMSTDSYDPAVSLDETPVRISHVCRKWRSIALATPVLWRRVFLNARDLVRRRPPGEPAETFLARSKGHAIEVVYTNRMSKYSPRLAPAAPVRGEEVPTPHPERAAHILPPIRSIYCHAEHDAMDYVLMQLRLDDPSPQLEAVDLALTNSTASKLFDALRFDLPAIMRNPWASDRFPNLQSLSLQDVALGCLPMGQLPKLRELTMQVSEWRPVGPYRDEFLRVIYLARLLACAPNIERLTFVRAGPAFHLMVNPDLPPNFWAQKAAWGVRGLESIPPVPLLALREIEWTGAHPDSLHYFFTHFPAPALEVLDVGFVDVDKHNVPIHGPSPINVASLSTASAGPAVLQPVLELANLKVLRVECTSGDVLRTPFLKLSFPALEMLSLSNLNLRTRWDARAQAGGGAALLPHLPRSESMFRDPRMLRLAHVVLSAFTILPDHAVAMLGYMPALAHLECDLLDGATALLAALGATRTARVGLPAFCPKLREIHLWCCDDVDFAALEAAVKLRNGFWEPPPPEEAAYATLNGRPMRPLRKTARVDAPRTDSVNIEEKCERIVEVRVEGCASVSEEQAMSLEQWGVDVVWFPPEDRD